MTKAEKAKELFLQGYNCSQSIAGAFCQNMDMDFNSAVKIASAFGGGMGRLREVCGAVSGIFMVLSAKCGYTDISDKQKKTTLYRTVQELAKEFAKKNGSIICRELLGGKADCGFIPDDRTEEYYKTRPCAEKVYDAACILEKYLSENNL